MTLTGTGTSQGVPVIGCRCAACRSTDPRDTRLRTAALIRAEAGNLAIDTGTDFRAQMLTSRTDRLDAVLLTHEHNDHTAGLDDLRPFCFQQKMSMPIYCLPRVARELKLRFAYAFTDYPGVPKLSVREVDFGRRLRLVGLEIDILEVLHAELPIVGFRAGSLAYLTDVKTLPDATLDKLGGLDTLVLSCLNHRGTHSHLSLEEALSYIERIGPRRAVLTHLSHRIGPTASVAPTLPVGTELGYDGMHLPF